MLKVGSVYPKGYLNKLQLTCSPASKSEVSNYTDHLSYIVFTNV